MKVRLQEIELGSQDVEKTKNFYQAIFGFENAVDQPNLSVFNLKPTGIDLNFSSHIANKKICISFLTDDLTEIMERLTSNSITFTGPKPSHLGMMCIEFNDPTGTLVKVNERGTDSPEWLQI